MSDNTIQVLARIFFQASNYGFHCDARIAAIRRVDDLSQVLARLRSGCIPRQAGQLLALTHVLAVKRCRSTLLHHAMAQYHDAGEP
ncbi:hypothetical protein Ddc_23518 [Ditylenchus destructor]|nr:hypothetical protein Ddc_23518 [Ditylenchus destructor]